MTARRGTGGGMPVPCGAPAAGGDRRNLRVSFKNLSAPAPGPDIESGRAAFKRSNLTQAVIDIGALLFGFLFLCSFAVGTGAAFVILFCGNCR
ncbi:MAG: hypothetical protein JWP25_5020 [Bradyrhizobium sp.]|nr:hypothetical protein [Bradyrhizobium sp.]